MTENNRQLVSMVLEVVIEGGHDKSLDEAASGLIVGLDESRLPDPDVLELSVLGLKTMVRHEFRDMIANRHWQLRHKEAVKAIVGHESGGVA